MAGGEDVARRSPRADLARMWVLLAVSPRRILVAVLWGVAALGSALGLAALSAWLIARAWQMPPVLDLSVAVVTVRALGISRGLARYLERLATHDVALRSMTTARTAVYRTLARSNTWMRSGPRAHPRRGDLLVRIGSDIDDLGAVVVRVFVPVVVALIVSLAAVGLLATMSLAAAAILAGALATSGILAPWMSARAARTAELAVRADRAEFTAGALTVLDHAAELRVAGRLKETFDATRAAGLRANAAEDSAASRSAWAAAATPLSIGVSVLGALLIGITRYGPTGGTPGAMTPMAFTILVLLPLSAFEAVAPLPAAARTLTTARDALRRLEAAAGRAVADGEGGRGPSDNADRARTIGTAALSSTLPRRPAGRRIAVIGPSGGGKTTLLMFWAGLFATPHPGVTFFAEDAHIFGTTVLENLRVARGDLTESHAERALRAVGLDDWLRSLPDGVHTDLVGGAAAVSGGQRRRILLARALVAPARILLLDEPTEHLEAEPGAQLLRDLLDVSSGLVRADRTVVVVTHQLPADHRADVVVHVDLSGTVTMVEATGFRRPNNPLHTHHPVR